MEISLMTDAPKVERLAFRLDEVAESLGVSRRHVERLLSAGKFPPPDRKLGRVPLWRVDTVRGLMGGTRQDNK
jgi:excisionase family DNA binding protein